jgi:hypothetical protein
MPQNPTKPHSSNTTPSSRPPQNFLNIFQHNCCRSNHVFISLFSILKLLNPDVVTIQDPYLFNNKPLNASGFSLIFDHSSASLKVATYISNKLLRLSSYITTPPVHQTPSPSPSTSKTPLFRFIMSTTPPGTDQPSWPRKCSFSLPSPHWFSETLTSTPHL